MEADMKKTICTFLAVGGLILMSSLPGYAGHGGYGGHGGHGHFSGSIWIGPGWGWGPWWGPAYPYYYPYPYYAAPPVVVQQPPDEYVQQPAPQSEEPSYWYYCQDPKGYYPYVKKCPNGWLKVVPSPAPSGEGE
jgi:hypothetical protein